MVMLVFGRLDTSNGGRKYLRVGPNSPQPHNWFVIIPICKHVVRSLLCQKKLVVSPSCGRRS